MLKRPVENRAAVEVGIPDGNSSRAASSVVAVPPSVAPSPWTCSCRWVLGLRHDDRVGKEVGGMPFQEVCRRVWWRSRKANARASCWSQVLERLRPRAGSWLAIRRWWEGWWNFRGAPPGCVLCQCQCQCPPRRRRSPLALRLLVLLGCLQTRPTSTSMQYLWPHCTRDALSRAAISCREFNARGAEADRLGCPRAAGLLLFHIAFDIVLKQRLLGGCWLAVGQQAGCRTGWLAGAWAGFCCHLLFMSC